MALSEEKVVVLQSLVPEITSHEDIYKSLAYTLDNQEDFFVRHLTGEDFVNWQFRKKFVIDLNKIDRIYGLLCDDKVELDCDFRCFLYCRVFFENKAYRTFEAQLQVTPASVTAQVRERLP